jgi:hypothetical protein
MKRTPKSAWSVHVLENRYPIKTACECDRPNPWRDTGNCLKCGHRYDPWSSLSRALTATE